MSRYLPVVAVLGLLLCGALIAGCASTPSTNATTAPTPSAPPTASQIAGATTATLALSPNETFPSSGHGSITGTKFNDLNADHRRDPDEPGLTGWTIVLETREQNGSAWVEVNRATTDDLGAYAFANLSAGDYRVSESTQSGWTQTFPTERDGRTELTISSDRTFWDGVDFGNYGGPAVTGTAGAAVTGTGTASTAPTATGTAAATTTTTTTASTTAGSVTVSLTAQNIAFDKSSITVPAGARVTVNFNNMDSGVPHNFAVYTDSSASTAIFTGQIVTGPTTTTYTFTAPSTPGAYFFRCDVHPTQMTGQLIVQ